MAETSFIYCTNEINLPEITETTVLLDRTVDVVLEKPDRRKSCRRWTILILQCLSSMGTYYCRDIFGVLYNTLKFQLSDLDDEWFQYYFSFLYSIYSIPNIILPFIGGILILKFGARPMYLIFTILVLIGQSIIAYGSLKNSITAMLIGRFVMGLGGECINSSKSMIIMKWFFKSEVALPQAISISVMRLGNIISDIISPYLIQQGSFTAVPLFFGAFVCATSVISTIVIIIMDYNEDKKEGHEELESKGGEERNFSSIKEFSILFWLSNILCMTLYATFVCFKYYSTGWLTSTIFAYIPMKKIAEEKAGIYISIPFFISTFLIPLFGYLIDIFGQRAYFNLGSSILGMIAYILLYYVNPLIAFSVLGVAYSIFSIASWAIISLAVDKKRISMAMGLKNSFQNLGYAVFPMVSAYIFNKTKNYDRTFDFYVILSAFTIILSIAIIYINYRTNGVINLTKFDESDEKKEKDNEKGLKELTDLENETDDIKKAN